MIKSASDFSNLRRSFLLGLSLLCIFGGALVFAQTKFPTGTFSSGEFSITFNADGTHSVNMNGEAMVKGNYVITENVIALTDKEGQAACEGTGKYKWKIQENSLSFEKIEDSCDGRVGALSQLWVKK